MKNTDKKNNELRKRSWLSETVFHKIASVMFYEKSFRKRFTWSNAKILLVARISILIVFKSPFEKTIS